MQFDVINFLLEGVDNAPIVILAVIALTYVAGRFGLVGKAQLGFAFALGMVFGGGLQIATFGTPETFAAWFWLIIYAVVLSVFPSLLYDQAKELLEKAFENWHTEPKG